MYIYMLLYTLARFYLPSSFGGCYATLLGIKHGDGKYIMYMCDLPIIYQKYLKMIIVHSHVNVTKR